LIEVRLAIRVPSNKGKLHMPNQELRMELINLKTKLSVSKSLVSAAQGQAGIPVIPNAPVLGLTSMGQAVAAQQQALDQIYKILEKMG